MNYKILLFFLLSLTAYKAFSMEAVIDQEEVQEVSRCKREFDVVISQLKFENEERQDINWKALDSVINRILKNIALDPNLGVQCLMGLNEITAQMRSQEPLIKVQMFFGFVSTFLGNTFDILTTKFLHENEDIDLQDNANIEKVNSITQGIVGKIFMKLLTENSDLWDYWFDYVRKNKIEDFEKDFFETEEVFNLDQKISKYIISADFFALIKLLQENYTEVVNEGLMNKAYGMNCLSLLTILIRISFSIPGNNFDDVQELVLRLFHEPRISTTVLALTKIALLEELKQIDKMSEITNFLMRLAMKQSYDLVLKYLKIINFRLDSINTLKEKLFEAVELQDVELTRRRAYELYTITRDFKDKNGDTPLHRAVLMGNQELITTLIGIYPGLLDVANNDGRTPISLAAGSKYLLELIFSIAKACKESSLIEKE